MYLRTLFDRFLLAKASAGAAEGTTRLYRVLFSGYLDFVRSHGHREVLSNFNARLIQDYLIHSHGYVKPNSVHNRACALSSFGTWLTKQGILQANPCDRVDRPRQVIGLPDVLSEPEVAALDGLSLPEDQMAMRAVLNHAGLRCEEVCQLDARDVRPLSGEWGMLYVRKAKGSSQRAIPLADARLREPLVGYLLSRGMIPPEDPVFRGPETSRLRDEQLRVLVRRWGERIGRPGLKPHQLRHSFATIWVEKGGDLEALRLILGHKQLTTTQRYVHLTQAIVGAEMARVAER